MMSIGGFRWKILLPIDINFRKAPIYRFQESFECKKNAHNSAENVWILTKFGMNYSFIPTKPSIELMIIWPKTQSTMALQAEYQPRSLVLSKFSSLGILNSGGI